MKRAEALAELRVILQERRRALQATSREAHEELQALRNQAPDAEYEENAQSALADFTLSAVMEGRARELELIEGAFRRMDQGAYGECVDCGADIPLDRLRALPYAIRCEADARQYERTRLGGPRQAHHSL